MPDEQAPFIDKEAQAVAQVLPGATLRIGYEATEQVLRTTGRGSRVIHIASHGFFRPENPMFSGIRLGDTYLNVYDLYRLRLRADLVTLSGCATGANVAAAGDELLGITRGLFCAGATTLVLSLWNVHDESTAQFMTGFYQRIADGADAAAAAEDLFARHTGIELRDVGPGWAKASMKIQPCHFNGARTVHGGAIFTLADFAFAAASNSMTFRRSSANSSSDQR